MATHEPQSMDRSLDRIDDTLCRIDETLTSIAESLKVLAKAAEASAIPIVLPPPAMYRQIGDEAMDTFSKDMVDAMRPRPRGVRRPSDIPNTEQDVKDLALVHRVTQQPEHPVAVYSFPRGVEGPMWKAYCLDPACTAFLATATDVIPDAQRVEYYHHGRWSKFWSLNGEAAEVFLRKEGEEEQFVCISCKGTGRGLNLGGGPDRCRVCRGTGFKVVAPYPLDTHDPKSHCRHPSCKDTNWGGHDRLHGRGDYCPPDDRTDGLWSSGGTSETFPGWVALGDQWDREHYLPTGREAEPTDTDEEPTDG